MKFNINSLKPKICRFSKTHNLKFVVLFGSVAVSKAKDESDIDIAILRFDHLPIKYKEYIEILDFFSGLFSEYEKIDLVDLSKTNILFRYEITSQSKLLYGDEAEYFEYKLLSFKEYVDSKSLIDLEKLLILKRQSAMRSFLKNDKKGFNPKKNLANSRRP